MDYIEFAAENLLGIYEMIAFRNQVKSMTMKLKSQSGDSNEEDSDNDAAAAGSALSTPTGTDEKGTKKKKKKVDFLSRIKFPLSIVSEVKSWIVTNQNWTNEQKYLALVDKYILDSSEFSVNIAFLCRTKLIKLADSIIDDCQRNEHKIKVKYKVFDPAIKQLFKLLTGVLDRYEYDIDVGEEQDDDEKVKDK